MSEKPRWHPALATAQHLLQCGILDPSHAIIIHDLLTYVEKLQQYRTENEELNKRIEISNRDHLQRITELQNRIYELQTEIDELHKMPDLTAVLAAIKEIPEAIELYNNGGSEYPNG